MDFDEIKPTTPGWNQIKSELVRNVTFFKLLEEKEQFKESASQGVQLMQDAIKEMGKIENTPEPKPQKE